MMADATIVMPFGKHKGEERGEPLPLPGDGSVDISVVADQTHGRVIINLGEPMACLSFTAEEASDLADGLHQCSLEARGIT